MPLEKQSLNNFLPDGFETNNLEGYKENFSADKIATGYEKDVKDRVSGPNFNNLLDVLGKNTNVLTNFMDFIKNMPINNIFVVDENNQLAYKPIDEVGGGGLEIGDIGIAPLGIDETKGKRRYLNGQIIIQEQYAGFTKKVKDAINLYPSLACSEDEWQTTATMTVGGQVGKFVVDNDAGTIRLPKIIMPIQGLTDLSKLAEIVEAGLPDHTHTVKVPAVYGQGHGAQTPHVATAIDSVFRTTGAKQSNPIYGNSDTVQQEQIQYPYFIQVATGAETEDNIVNTLELNNPFVLLEPKFFENEIYNISWLLANGSYNGSNAVHPSAYQALLVENNAEVAIGSTVTLPISTEYTKRGLSVKLSTDSDITDYDFVVNTSDETFRLPIKVNLASSKAVVGNGMTLGLTDGTNNYGSNHTSGNRAVALSTSSYGAIVGTTGSFSDGSSNVVIGITTDPTKSGIETSDSGLYLYFYVGETVQNANLINAGRIEEKIADLITVVETYKNGTSWYRIYSDGWCEQGGYFTCSSAGQILTFLKQFTDINYTITASGGTNKFGTISFYDRTPSQVATWTSDDDSFNAGDVSWLACGYIA